LGSSTRLRNIFSEKNVSLQPQMQGKEKDSEKGFCFPSAKAHLRLTEVKCKTLLKILLKIMHTASFGLNRRGTN